MHIQRLEREMKFHHVASALALCGEAAPSEATTAQRAVPGGTFAGQYHCCMDRVALIARFINRQYVSDEGDVRQNVESLFAADLVYHTGEQTLSREDLVVIGTTVRATPQRSRHIEARDFEQEGDTVRWRLSAHLPATDSEDEDLHQESVVTALFGPDEKVIRVWSTPAA